MTRAIGWWTALVLALPGCLDPEPDRAAPFAPLPAAERVAVVVGDVRNDTPAAVVAQVTGPTRALLANLLGRTGRFLVVEPGHDAPFRLEVAVTEFRDEDARGSVIQDRAQLEGPRRRAVVELRFRLVDARGRAFVEGDVAGEHVQPGLEHVRPPEPDDLTTGAWWNTPFGRATRQALDRLVRRLDDVTTGAVGPR